MNYLTTDEISKLWNVSSRRVTTLCNSGRVDGAEFKGGIWLIPSGTSKPEVKKRGRKPQKGADNGN